MASQKEVEDHSASAASFYALHVALQTLKERCQNLQSRLTRVEEENETLRRASGADEPPRNPSNNGDNEAAYLRNMVGDLVRQKTQLTEHIAMVTKENRQLWSKLSKLTKENTSLGLNMSKIRDAINATPPVEAKTSTTNNLIRSKTFTRPTPKLRDRQPVDEQQEEKDDQDDELEANMSLEEISLQIINKLVEGKESFEQKCGQILDTTTSENLCFGFKDGGGQSADAVEVSETIERCTSETTAVREALVQQQTQLKQLIQGLRDSKKPICNDCIKRHSEGAPKKPTTGSSDSSNIVPTEKAAASSGISAALEMDRTCPMCGKCYDKSDFEIFQRHVEWHFIDDNEVDLSLEKNYDMISHTQNF